MDWHWWLGRNQHTKSRSGYGRNSLLWVENGNEGLVVCNERKPPPTEVQMAPFHPPTQWTMPPCQSVRSVGTQKLLAFRCHPDLGSASHWLNQISHAAQPIRSTTQIWIVRRHWYGISALVSQMSFGGENSGASPNVGCFLRLAAIRHDV